jgi:prevent-host-death family protein
VYSIKTPFRFADPAYSAIRMLQAARRTGAIDRWPSHSYLAFMSTHTVAETKNQLSKLIERALKGEHIVVTRRGQPVVELKPMHPAPRPVTEADIEWLRARRVGRRMPKTDAATLVRQMRDEEER